MESNNQNQVAELTRGVLLLNLDVQVVPAVVVQHQRDVTAGYGSRTGSAVRVEDVAIDGDGALSQLRIPVALRRQPQDLRQAGPASRLHPVQRLPARSLHLPVLPERPAGAGADLRPRRPGGPARIVPD